MTLQHVTIQTVQNNKDLNVIIIIAILFQRYEIRILASFILLQLSFRKRNTTAHLTYAEWVHSLWLRQWRQWHLAKKNIAASRRLTDCRYLDITSQSPARLVRVQTHWCGKNSCQHNCVERLNVLRKVIASFNGHCIRQTTSELDALPYRTTMMCRRRRSCRTHRSSRCHCTWDATSASQRRIRPTRSRHHVWPTRSAVLPRPHSR